MANTESDGIEESLDGALRMGITVAAQIGQEVSRLREAALRKAEEDATREAARARTEYEAERTIAHAKLAPTANSEWWDSASPERIAEVHQYATTWKNHDPEAQAASERIRTEVSNRYGIDVDNTGIDASRMREGAAKADALRDEAASERKGGAGETVEAQSLAAEADRLDRERDSQLTKAEQAPEPSARAEADARADFLEGEHSRTASGAESTYDSAERRQALASSLEGKADAETIDARLRADRDQGTHPRSAVLSAAKKAPRAVRTLDKSQERSAGLGR